MSGMPFVRPRLAADWIRVERPQSWDQRSGSRIDLNGPRRNWTDSVNGLCNSRSMTEPDYLTQPDAHLSPVVAASYDGGLPKSHRGEAITSAVGLLSELVGHGAAVEFAVGTGRIALPLSEAGTTVLGIDFSEAMLAVLGKKPGADAVSVTLGDMTKTQVCSDASLVYLVFNSITNLRSQEMQLECFRNAAAHLAPGGRFVIENGVPKLHQLAPGESVRPFNVSARHLGFDEYVDRVNQISISHHYHINGDRVRTSSPSFRYVWPSELDLMAQMAGMKLENRWADWNRNEFVNDSPSHVSVWRKV